MADTPMAERRTEIDDAIEQILHEYVDSPLARISARNRICRVLMDAGVDIFQQVPQPPLIADIAEQLANEG